jgi:hypothetical protein
MVTQTRWAVLLCKFKNDQSEPPTVPDFRAICDRFFTHPNAGYNAFQFFSDMSHGNVDLTGSEVLGWFTINANQGDSLPQGVLMNLAKQAAVNAGVDLRRFFGTILIMNLMTGWAQGDGNTRSVWADWRRIDGRNPDGTLGTRVDTGGGNGTEVFGQEMGHGYRLNHSRREGSNAEYQDLWDIMSSCASSAGSCPVYTAIDQEWCAKGPGLNAWNMRSLGWLDESRVWRVTRTDESFDGSVQLRPLHRHDLPGNLAVEIPTYDETGSNYLLEFRIKNRWDEGIPRSIVLVHQFGQAQSDGFGNGHSIIMRGTSGRYDLANGDVFERPPHINVQVTSIDEASETAALQIALRPLDPLEQKRRECIALKENIDSLDQEIRQLEDQIIRETDEINRKFLEEELKRLQDYRRQSRRQYQNLGCEAITGRL